MLESQLFQKHIGQMSIRVLTTELLFIDFTMANFMDYLVVQNL